MAENLVVKYAGIGVLVVGIVAIVAGVLAKAKVASAIGFILAVLGFFLFLAASIFGEQRRPMNPGDAWAISVTVIFFILVGLVGAGQLSVVGYTANVQTQTYNYQGFWGVGNAVYKDSGTNDLGPTGGVLDQTDYIASWSAGLVGQTVSFEGGFVAPSNSVCGWPDNWGYRVILFVPGSTPISGWTTVVPNTYPQTYGQLSSIPDPNTMANSIWVPAGGSPPIVNIGARDMAPASYWVIASPDGLTIIPEGSVVHVEFWVHFPGSLCGIWKGISTDEARIHTGIGSATFDQRLYQIGDTAYCYWNIGYVSDPQKGLGWSMTIMSQAQGYNVVANNPSLSALQGSLAYRVTVADWSPNRGKLICDLRNNLFSKDFDAVGVIDNKSLAPSLTVTGISPQSPNQGQNVTVTWTDSPNPVTLSPIARIEVLWGWGAPSTFANLSGNVTSYTFTASQSGYVMVVVMAWDQAGRPSASTKLTIQVNAQAPNGGLSGGGGPSTVPNWILWAAILLLLVGIPMLLAGLYVPMGPIGRIILILIGSTLTLIGGFFGITIIVDQIATWLNVAIPIKFW